MGSLSALLLIVSHFGVRNGSIPRRHCLLRTTCLQRKRGKKLASRDIIRKFANIYLNHLYSHDYGPKL